MKIYNLKKIIFAILLFALPVQAKEVPVTIVPLEKISTTDKNLSEGSIVWFKDVDTQRKISGVVRKITPNGFMGEQAFLLINNFKYEDEKQPLGGQLNLKGNEHAKYQEMANGGFAPVSEFIRGGEVILEPQKTKLIVFLDKDKNTSETALRLIPADRIYSGNDGIEIGDKIKFYTESEVYKNGKLYIKKGAIVLGTVEYISENGWVADNAQIDFKYFKLRTETGEILKINSPVSINGFEILKYKGKRMAQFFNYIGVIFRGKEVDIIPTQDNVVLTVWVK